MFKQASSADQISQDMWDSLVKQAATDAALPAPKNESAELISQACELIAEAAESLDQAGMVESADQLDLLLNRIASDGEEFIKNEKETGTMFPRSQFHADDKQSEELEIDPKDLEELERMFEEEN